MKWILILLLVLSGCGFPFDGASNAGNGLKMVVEQHGHEAQVIAQQPGEGEFLIEFENGEPTKVTGSGVVNIFISNNDLNDGGTALAADVPLPTTQPSE